MRQNRRKTPLHDLCTYGHGRAVRHPEFDYGADIDIHVTMCADRGEPFRRAAIARMVCDNVEFYCGQLGYRLYGYTLMPDHLHVLLSPGASGKPLSHWLNLFKSYTTNRFFKEGNCASLWQHLAHDHVCREGETADKVLAYIVNNPVRAGLVTDWEDWPWTKVLSGS